MKILVLTFYYPPDLSAGAYRMVSVVEQLRRQGGSDLDIRVLTTLPNRYITYQPPAELRQALGNVTVERIDVGEHRSGMSDQSRAFLRFALGVRRATRGHRYDLVLATSSRLFTAFLGALVRRRTGGRLYLDIRDIFRESIGDILSRPWYLPLRAALKGIESFTFTRADRICLVSEGFRDYFQGPGGRKCVVFTNGIDPEFRIGGFDKAGESVKPVILYAGNIGEGQGLHDVIPAAARMLPDYEFRLVGDGGRRQRLEAEVSELDNVVILPPVSRAELLTHYAGADYLLLHLNRYRAFERVLPSKLFEYAATGKPVLAGVAGYARRFIETEIDNAAVFDPCDARGLAEALGTLEPRPTNRSAFVERFDRERIAREYAEDILELAAGGGRAE